MKIQLLALSFMIMTGSCIQNSVSDKSQTIEQPVTVEESYDSLLASRTGADERGMKQYVMAFLRKGPNRSQDSATAAQIQAGHMENIGRMADAGQLAVAGPFMDDGDIRGIYIFNTPSVDTAAAWTATDPAMAAGRLVMELHPWYGSAALIEVNDIHKKLQKKNR